MEYAFWVSFGIIVYTYLGYPILLGLLVKIKKATDRGKPVYYSHTDLPEITFIVACYNEADLLEQKIQNTLELNYPIDKKKFFFVTDGSTDSSVTIIKKYPQITLFHEPERKGKNAAINRVIQFVDTPIIIFSDANTFLNQDALVLLARHYKDEKVGAVAGEKRVFKNTEDNAAGSGEGAYWKYESKLKHWDSELRTVVGAAGELFSIRTKFYEVVPAAVLIEDFRLSMNIAKRGFRVIYEPAAYAMETGSASIEEENKRKVRISAGGLIEVWYFKDLLNFFKYGVLTFQYVSHRMLRWTFAPLSLLVILLSNLVLSFRGSTFFEITLVLQIGFYLTAFAGHALRNRKIGFGVLFVPYYFMFMNYSVFQGAARLLRGKQSAIWDKAKRAA